MVRALEQEQENYRSRLYHFKGMNENAGGRHVKSLSTDDSSSLAEYSSMDDRITSRGHQPPRPVNEKGPRSRSGKDEAGAAGKDNKNPGKSDFFFFLIKEVHVQISHFID
jgi:hypothetical protein